MLCAANGVAHTLAGAPARCLHLDVPSASGGDVSVTAAFLEFRGALWVVLSEGAEVNEVSAGVGAARLLDACVASLGPGVADQASPVWEAGSAARACAEATLTRTLSLLAEGGDFEYNVLRPDWLAHAFVSAEAAAQRAVAEGPAMWEFRAALLRQLDDLEEDAGSALAEAINRRAVEAMTDFLSSNRAASLAAQRSGDDVDPSSEGEEEPSTGSAAAAAAAPGAAARRPPRASPPTSAPMQPTDTQRIRCLRRLRLSVQGSAIGLCMQGAPPVLLVDRIRSNGAAAFTALALATVEPALFSPSGSVRRACAHLYCPAPAPPSSSLEGGGAPAGSGMTSEAEAEEAGAVGAAALRGLVPPTAVLAAQGALLAPCALDPALARSGLGKLHTVLAALPLPPFPASSEVARPPSGAAPRLPVRVEEAGRVRAWGGAAQKYARVPTLVVLLQVLQPPAPREEEEGAPVAAFADACCAGALGGLEEHCQRAAALVAKAGAMAHLGALLQA